MSSIFAMKLAPQNIICLNVEFTDPYSPELLSLGLVSSNGGEHYAELDLQDAGSASVFARCSDFVRRCGVLEQWGCVPESASTYAQMAQRTSDWLSAESGLVHARSGRPALLAFEHPSHFSLIVHLLREHGHWALLQSLVEPLNVRDLTCRFDAAVAADAAFESLKHRGLARHHALADAQALRAAVHAVLTGRRLKP